MKGRKQKTTTQPRPRVGRKARRAMKRAKASYK